jgi:Rhodopirellula transposase DDE domain/Transposase IS116/IS110/IS902 family
MGGALPWHHESAGKRRRVGTPPCNQWLRRALVEAARAAARTKDTYFAAQYRQIARRRGPKAAVAVAHSLLDLIWHLLSTGSASRTSATTSSSAAATLPVRPAVWSTSSNNSATPSPSPPPPHSHANRTARRAPLDRWRTPKHLRPPTHFTPDRAPAVLPHHHELAGQAPDQPRGGHPDHAATRTSGGLRVEAALDPGDYPTGVAISTERLDALPIERHAVHGTWNSPSTPSLPPAPPRRRTSVSRAVPPSAARPCSGSWPTYG